MLCICGGQFWKCRVGPKIRYKGAEKKKEFCHNGDQNNCEVHVELHYDWFCYIHMSYVLVILFLSYFTYIKYHRINFIQ